MKDVLRWLQQLTPVEELARRMLHGPHLADAAKDTVLVLQEYYRYAGHEPAIYELLRPAALNGSLELCTAIMDAMESSEGAELGPDDTEDLMSICMTAACDSRCDLSQAIKYFEFANRCDCKSNHLTFLCMLEKVVSEACPTCRFHIS
jgi:hypothetical protein